LTRISSSGSSRRPDEMPNIVFNVVLGVLALAVAIGRSVIDLF
jgi:hypothetical protein